MFTGLIEACVPLKRVETRGDGRRLWISSPGADWSVTRGQSVAVSGACLSVAAAADPRSGREVPVGTPGADLAFDVSAETLKRTWFGGAVEGRRVNLERAMRLGDRLDGHLVAGHVDGIGRIIAIDDAGDGGSRMRFEVEPRLDRYLVDKGSITLDGISLTVVSPSARTFEVAVIPLTLEKTSLGGAASGQAINVEADMLGKWIERLVAARS
jgi:riboflavin synthase